MIKIYDCSNSEERPEHRGNGGPIQNDVMRYLAENAHNYGCEFISTDRYKEIDILITNDVFPEYTDFMNVPRLKRMDGIFFQEQYKKRNIPLVMAAHEADHVIFISEFSKRSFEESYCLPLESCSVALNQVDPNVFKPIDNIYRAITKKEQGKVINFISIANDWSRPEKRFNDILEFAKVIDGVLFLVGKIPEGIRIPDNVTSFGYKSNPEILNYCINCADAFVNFSYKDAAPKTVLQGLCCGLPVLYANSGGLSELVEREEYGIAFPDIEEETTFIPALYQGSMGIAYEVFKSCYPLLKQKVLKRDNKQKFKEMLDEYFFHIRRLVDETR